MGWETSKPHKSTGGQRQSLGRTHSDIQYRSPKTGKVDWSAGKGKISGSSRKTSFLDALSGNSRKGRKR